MMTIGTIVYLCWYDFNKKTENVCKGEVVDNSLWDGTKWQGYVNVSFQPPSLSGAIQHHFKEDQLSLTHDNVPHDDCYLTCGKNTRFLQHDYTVRCGSATSGSSPSDAWQRVQQFKQDHWDYEHGHLAVDALDEYYQLWHDAIAAKRGYQPDVTVPCNSVAGVTPATIVPSDSVTLPSHNKSAVPAASPTGKHKRTTGSITYTDSIQTSFFD